MTLVLLKQAQGLFWLAQSLFHNMGFSFEGKKVLTTGGSGGLGSALVKAFHESGAIVYALDIDETGLAELTTKFPGIHAVVADVTKWDDVKKKVEQLGPLDHLVNNVGVYVMTANLNVSEAESDRMFDINFKAALNISQVFANAAIAHGIKDATIVNISSIASMTSANEGGPIYSCTKAALDMLTRNHALYLGEHGIRVNSVNPSLMKTPLADAFPPEFQAHVNGLISRQPIKGMIPTLDVANLVMYLSSTLSNCITGRNIPVDGGYLLC